MQIYEANKARVRLRRKGYTKKALTKLRDDRAVKGPRNGFSMYHEDRFKSGDFGTGITVGAAATRIAEEWKALSAAERKVSSLMYASYALARSLTDVM